MKSRTTRLASPFAVLGMVLAALFLFATSAGAATTGPPPPGGGPGTTVTNPHPTPGESITVSGSKCAPRAEVTITLDGSTVLGTGTTDSQGGYRIPVTIPTSATPGSHTIAVTGGQCAGPNTVNVEVLSPSGSGSGLASTGVAVIGIAGLGLALLIGGGLLVLAGRRRAASHL